MHWSKRVIFFVTLIAFLSNLAFGMSLPQDQRGNDQIAITQAEHAQFKHPSNEYSPFSTCEFLEEIEEAEQEADFDEYSVFEQQSIDHQLSADGYFDTNCHETPHPEFTGRNFRNWLYKNNIGIHFQVFRI